MKMSRGTVELDLFGIDKQHSNVSSNSNSQFRNFIHRRTSFPGIQNVISKMINPENGVMLSSKKSFSVPTSPNGDQNIPFTSLPVYVPQPCRPNSDSLKERSTKTMTIFYNGNVSVFEVSVDKAESIMRIISSSSNVNKNSVESDKVLADFKQPLNINPTHLIDPLSGDLPIARKKSLQRFLEKRKERLTSAVSPYSYGC